jgi:hypothetical protein
MLCCVRHPNAFRRKVTITQVLTHSAAVISHAQTFQPQYLYTVWNRNVSWTMFTLKMEALQLFETPEPQPAHSISDRTWTDESWFDFQQGKKFPSSPKRSDLLWSRPDHLVNGYWEGKAAGACSCLKPPSNAIMACTETMWLRTLWKPLTAYSHCTTSALLLYISNLYTFVQNTFLADEYS